MPRFQLEDARRAVGDACRIAQHVRRSADRLRDLTKHDRSPVTVADFAVQACIRRAVDLIEPSLGIVGEERADLLRQASESATLSAVVEAVRLVHPDMDAEAVLAAIDGCAHTAGEGRFLALDPIDGTKGFLRGGHFAVALAELDGGDVQWGVLGCPALDPDLAADPEPAHREGCILFAAREEGAFQSSASDGEPRPLRLPRWSPADPVRLCESAEAAHSDQSASAAVAQAIGAQPAFIRIDSQTKYALLARGQAEAYLRLPTRPDYDERIWDHAAGCLIASEAGARITDIHGASLDFTRGITLSANRGVVCATPDLHPPIIKALNERTTAGARK